jgi:hypothetical protein
MKVSNESFKWKFHWPWFQSLLRSRVCGWCMFAILLQWNLSQKCAFQLQPERAGCDYLRRDADPDWAVHADRQHGHSVLWRVHVYRVRLVQNVPWLVQNVPWLVQNVPWLVQNVPWLVQKCSLAKPYFSWSFFNQSWLSGIYKKAPKKSPLQPFFRILPLHAHIHPTMPYATEKWLSFF